MNANEKIYVAGFYCDTCEDDYENGEVDSVRSQWNSHDMRFNTDTGYDSMSDALKAVCVANGFDFRKDEWSHLELDGDEIQFGSSFIVDENNSRAANSELELWRDGRKTLYACHINVYLVKRASVPFEEDDLILE